MRLICFRAVPILAGVLTLGAVATATAQTVPIPDPFGFSGGETFVRFDDPGLVDGDPVPDIAGASFVLSNGAPARYQNVFIPHQWLPPNPGSITNALQPSPVPDIVVHFPGVVNRVGFEVVADPLDSLVVTLRSSGDFVDRVVLPNYGSNLFFFHAFENLDGFDEMRVDAGPRNGRIYLDNLLFEAVGSTSTDPLPLWCVGFRDHVADMVIALRSGESPVTIAELQRWLWGLTGRELRVELLDGDGVAMTSDDLAAPPLAHVLFAPADGGDPVDVTADVVPDPLEFLFDDQEWSVPLDQQGMLSAGTYTVTVESGDASYFVESTCRRSFVTAAPHGGVIEE